MCNPPAIIAALSAASTVAQGFQARQQGQFRSEVGKFNARVAENEAVKARKKGVEEESRVRERVAQFQAGQRAQFAAAGVDVGSGSPLQVQADTLTLGEVDALRVRTGFEEQALALETQAELELAQGRAAKKAGENTLGGFLLKAAGKGVAGKWYTPTSAANDPATESVLQRFGN